MPAVGVVLCRLESAQSLGLARLTVTRLAGFASGSSAGGLGTIRSASADRGLTTRLPGFDAVLAPALPEAEPASGRREKVPSTSERRCRGAGGTGGRPVGRLSTRRSDDPECDLSEEIGRAHV